MGKPLFWIVTFILFLPLIFFRPVFSGRIPLPLDVMVGGYYPWLDYKWGYVVGVPYKNASLSDVFSQLYPWRTLAADMMRHGHLPLWNPYSFSGTPLLANWQSAPFYPLNLFLLLLGPVWGWSTLLFLQLLLSVLFMYFYLRVIHASRAASLTGGIVFAFSGFMMTYLEYATTGQIIMWLPLALLLWEKFVNTRNFRFLYILPLILFFVFTGGFFQPAVYFLIVCAVYFMWRSPSPRRLPRLILPGLILLWGVGTAALQLLPTWELLGLSIRSLDHNIIEYSYGLLPLKNLITLWSPDFFGNPSTQNFWGFMGYQETAGYFSVIAICFAVWGITKAQTGFHRRFFTLVFLATLLLAFKNPVSQSVYRFSLPGLSTGYASRWLILTTFAGAVLAGLGIDAWSKKPARFFRIPMFTVAALSGLIIGLYFVVRTFNSSGADIAGIVAMAGHYRIGLRNTLVPVMLLSGLCLILFLPLPKRLKPWLFMLLISLDLLRFAVKFTPFSPAGFTKTSLPVIDYISQNIGNYRMEREKKTSLPPNTWTYFRLMTPSGYDPLYPKTYAWFYHLYATGPAATQSAMRDFPPRYFTRYAENDSYDSQLMNLAGVKYLLAVKKDAEGHVTPDGIFTDYRISTAQFIPKFTDGASVVLENIRVLPRVKLYSGFDVRSDSVSAIQLLAQGYDFTKRIIIDRDPGIPLGVGENDRVEITSYQPDRVRISASTGADSLLLLTDSNYPGWKADIDGNPTTVMTAFGNFRAVLLPAGTHTVTFSYFPASFTAGFMITVVSLLIAFKKLKSAS